MSSTGANSGKTAASDAGQQTIVGELDEAGEGELQLGERIGRLRIVAHVGAGAMGIVYAAYDSQLDRKVALKIVRPDRRRARHGSGASRLIREAQALARLAHPNVVPVYDVGTHGDRVYLTMELVEGHNLRQWLAARPRRWQDVLDVMIDAGRGLAAAHAAQLVHRDFKPDNVLVDDRGRARVTDFGLARALGGSDSDHGDLVDAVEAMSSQLTRTGAVMGTPGYMSPEQHFGRAAEPASDQYAFCVALYEVVYGTRPFGGGNIRDIAHAKWLGNMPDPRELGADVRRAPVALRAVIARGLARDPSERWPDMASLVDALVRIRRRRRSGGLLLAAASTIIVVGSWAWIALGPRRCDDDGEWSQWKRHGRDDLAAAFASSPSPAADDAWPRVRDGLDARFEGLRTARRELCEATRAHTAAIVELDARRTCLTARAAELRATVTALAVADRDTVGNALALVDRLRPLEDCTSSADLDGLSLPPPATDDHGLRDALLVIDARIEAGQYGIARDEAVEALDQARAQHDRAAATEAQYLRGTAELRLGEIANAQADLTEAFHAAQELGLERVALAIATRMVFLHATQTRNVAEAEVWLRHANALLARLGEGNSVARAKLLENEAHLLHEKGETDAAEQGFRAALALRIATGGEDSREASMVRNNLGNLMAERGDYDEALQQHTVAYANRVARLGPRHPEVAMSLVNLARVYEAQGKHHEALSKLDQAEPLVAESYGEHSTVMASLLVMEGSINLLVGDPELARQMLDRAAEIRAARLGPDHIELAQIDNARGVTYLRLGDLARADRAFAEALRRIGDPGHRDEILRAHVEGNLARLRLREGDFTAAERLARASIAVLERERGEERAGVAKSIGILIHALLAQGRVDEAETWLAIARPPAAIATIDAQRKANAEFLAAWAANLRGAPIAVAIAAAERARALAIQDMHVVVPGDTAELDDWLAAHDPARAAHR